ncbi:hypothetical protein [Haloplanus salilacus]|uniref:hypothetical protein n=1 Tax=Haloplanus salilacus TaxID=2949994 RepID=UPI0030D3D548
MSSLEYPDAVLEYEQARGWTTDLTELREGVYIVSGERKRDASSEKMLLMIVCKPENEITSNHIEFLIKAGREKDINSVMLTYTVQLTENAQEQCEKYGVDIIDSEKVRSYTESGGFDVDITDIQMPGSGSESQTDISSNSKLLTRRNAVLLLGGIGTVALLGNGGNNGLELIDAVPRREPSGWAIWHFNVKNTGETQNARAYVDIRITTGENAGEVTESYDSTKVIESGETADIRVDSTYYTNTEDYEFDYGIEPTDRPHATFEVASEDSKFRLDASESTSVTSSITSYEWSAHEFTIPEYGEPLNWNIPDGEIIDFEVPSKRTLDLVLKVTDEEGRTDEKDKRLSRSEYWA